MQVRIEDTSSEPLAQAISLAISVEINPSLQSTVSTGSQVRLVWLETREPEGEILQACHILRRGGWMDLPQMARQLGTPAIMQSWTHFSTTPLPPITQANR